MSSLVRSFVLPLSLTLASLTGIATTLRAETYDLIFAGPQIYPRTWQTFDQEQKQLNALNQQSDKLNWYLQHGDASEQQLARGLLAKRDELARAVETRRVMLEDQTLPTTLRIDGDPPPRQMLEALAALLRRDIGQQGKTFIYAGGKIRVWDQASGAAIPLEKLLAAANSRPAAKRQGDEDSARDPRSIPVPVSPAGSRPIPTIAPSIPTPLPAGSGDPDGGGGLFGQP